MHEAKPLIFCNFDESNPLSLLTQTNQVAYLREYLRDLGVKSIVVEPNYFDRDYLSEFASFYAVSSRGYTNICKRLHFFKEAVGRKELESALGEDAKGKDFLQKSYLGFCVLRPIPSAPLGRTVVALYPNNSKEKPPRVTNPARPYNVHLGGIELCIAGLAWQQQDTGVAACATIGIWTMLHSSAFDEHHAIPTTADITKAAHRTASLGTRIFPSLGLNIFQLAEAIKEHGFTPIISEGDIKKNNGIFFSRERFSSTCAAFIRSGYPILLVGNFRENGNCLGHAQCVVGFRDTLPQQDQQNLVSLADAGIEYLYIHDDNLGPHVRFLICVNEDGQVYLKADAPTPCYGTERKQSPTTGYPNIWPEKLVVAVHNDLRTFPDQLHKAGIEITTILSNMLQSLVTNGSGNCIFASRFIALTEYCGNELKRMLESDPVNLARVRMELIEKCPPMSLHLGLVRIAFSDLTPLVDILFDTTDSDRNHPVFAHVSFSPLAAQITEEVFPAMRNDLKDLIPDLGNPVRAFAQ